MELKQKDTERGGHRVKAGQGGGVQRKTGVTAPKGGATWGVG